MELKYPDVTQLHEAADVYGHQTDEPPYIAAFVEFANESSFSRITDGSPHTPNPIDMMLGFGIAIEALRIANAE